MSKNFISVEELAGCYQQSDVVIIDCRFSLADVDAGEQLYGQGHIEGAFYLHLDCNMSGPKSEHGGRHPLPDTHVFEMCLQSLGVNDDTLVVAYDDSRFAFAARLWWLLKYFGHDRVKILDGGYSAWSQAGLPVTTESIETPPSDHVGNVVLKPQPDKVVGIEQVKNYINHQDVRLVDSREPARFLGLEEPIDPMAGHIDSALNYPWQHVTDDDGVFTGAEQQQERWSGLKGNDLVVYCGSGVTACVNLLSLSEIGRDDAKLYAGSWSDWCSYL